MTQGYKQLVSALQRRYDYHSARAVAQEALQVAGLEKSASYEPKQWAKLLKATAETGDDLDGVWTALGDAPKGVKLKVEAPAETAEPAAEEPQVAAPKAAAPKAKKKPASKKRKG